MTTVFYAWLGLLLLLIFLLIRKVRLKPVCPGCGRRSTDRIKRPLLVKRLLFFLPLTYMECWFCHKKYYVLALSKWFRKA